jgi:hypothetical protein
LVFKKVFIFDDEDWLVKEKNLGLNKEVFKQLSEKLKLEINFGRVICF